MRSSHVTICDTVTLPILYPVTWPYIRSSHVTIQDPVTLPIIRPSLFKYPLLISVYPVRVNQKSYNKELPVVEVDLLWELHQVTFCLRTCIRALLMWCLLEWRVARAHLIMTHGLTWGRGVWCCSTHIVRRRGIEIYIFLFLSLNTNSCNIKNNIAVGGISAQLFDMAMTSSDVVGACQVIYGLTCVLFSWYL